MGLVPPRPRCARSFRQRRCMRNAHLSDRFEADIWLKREDLSPVRSYKLRGAFNAMRKASSGPGPLRLRQCRQPCAGRRLHVPAFRGAGGDLHAGHHAAAEDPEDPDVRRRPGRDPPDRGLFRRHAGGGPGLVRAIGRAFPVAVRRCRRDRGPGFGRGRDRGPARRACRMSWSCRWAVAACPPASPPGSGTARDCVYVEPRGGACLRARAGRRRIRSRSSGSTPSSTARRWVVSARGPSIC